MKHTLQRFQFLLETLPLKLKQISEADFSKKPSNEKWSKKQILGHLIDSAANNHQRFIRTQYENIPFIVYEQNQWNQLNHYQQLPSEHVINFWTLYNTHLLEVIKHIPIQNYLKTCNSGLPEPATLEWLIVDYVAHLEHHLKQIVEY